MPRNNGIKFRGEVWVHLLGKGQELKGPRTCLFYIIQMKPEVSRFSYHKYDNKVRDPPKIRNRLNKHIGLC